MTEKTIEQRVAELEAIVAGLVPIVAGSSVAHTQAGPDAPIKKLVERAAALTAPQA